MTFCFVLHFVNGERASFSISTIASGILQTSPSLRAFLTRSCSAMKYGFDSIAMMYFGII
ncbi:hypothetical protein BcepF1.059 [Burkholderia phage BcepF1]|uniref:Uncharacterized protein n=1 Tax=Burkholderia phage BcepF1 TaxID=2886897 RepID=A1YZW3_9CAUD|nr:hypothetical protein BcepF1.059 [Burkholderia phage BcepF1]ABL96790.1 hypothetical protein BcepF1.059 [Burkholderia phage BcepF1]